MSQVHAIVWLDHREAKTVGFSYDRSETAEIRSERSAGRIHRKSGVPGSGHAADDHHFFDEIVAAVADVGEILITGPGTAKTAFETYISERHPAIAQRVVGVETLDHPSEGELLAYGRKYFKRVDQLGLS